MVQTVLQNVRVSPVLPLKSVRGVRDLGGYPFSDSNGSGITRTRTFLRAGSLRGISAGDIDALRQYGVRRIIDLRSPFELKLMGDAFSRGKCQVFDYVSVPLLDQLNSSGFGGTLPARMSDVYCELLDDNARDLGRVFEALDCEGTVLFHCRAGKDRTGVIAMLLLKLVGVDDRTVIADYAVTERYMGRGLEAQRRGLSVLLRRRVPRCLFQSKPEEMERTLAHLYERYGSARAYLEGAAGVPAATLDRIAQKFQGADVAFV